MQGRRRLKRIGRAVLAAGICCAFATVLVPLAETSEAAASVAGRLVATCGVALLAAAVYRRCALTPADLVAPATTARGRRVGVLSSAAALLLAALCSSALVVQADPAGYLAVWICTFACGTSCIPLGIQVLRDNGVHAPLPPSAYALAALPLACLVAAESANGVEWDCTALVPAAFGLCLLPLSLWAYVLQAAAAENVTLPLRSQGVLAPFALMSIAAFALSAGLLVNLGAFPLADMGVLLPRAVAGGALACCTALVTLHLLGYDYTKTLERMQLEAQADNDATQAAPSAEGHPAAPQADPDTMRDAAAPAGAGVVRTVSPDAAFGRQRPSMGERNEQGVALLAEHFKLTKREREVMLWVAHGMNRNAIAENMCLSRNTVNAHARHAYEKIGVHRREDLMKLIDEMLSDAGHPEAARPQETP